MSCMYLDDVGDRFSAITAPGTGSKKGPHWNLWDRNVQAVFESGEWRNVNYLDVIQGSTVDTAIRDKLANLGTSPGKYFDAKGHRVQTGKMTAIGTKVKASVLSNPKPPEPAIVNIEPIRKPTGKKKSSSFGLGVAAVAAGGAAYYLTRKKRKGR